MVYGVPYVPLHKRVVGRGCHHLVVLDISDNNFDEIPKVVLRLTLLRKLLAARNSIRNLEETAGLLGRLRSLEVVDLRGNPIARESVYHASIAAACSSLTMLDASAITDAA